MKRPIPMRVLVSQFPQSAYVDVVIDRVQALIADGRLAVNHEIVHDLIYPDAPSPAQASYIHSRMAPARFVNGTVLYDLRGMRTALLDILVELL